jgi:hypothetical protein
MAAELVTVGDYADPFVPPPNPCNPAKDSPQFVVHKNPGTSHEAHTLDDQARTRKIRLDVDNVAHLHAGEQRVKHGLIFTMASDSSNSSFQKLFT